MLFQRFGLSYSACQAARAQDAQIFRERKVVVCIAIVPCVSLCVCWLRSKSSSLALRKTESDACVLFRVSHGHSYMTQALGPGGRGSLLSRFMDVFNVTVSVLDSQTCIFLACPPGFCDVAGPVPLQVKSLKRTENTESWTTSDRMLLVVMNNVFHRYEGLESVFLCCLCSLSVVSDGLKPCTVLLVRSDDRPECCGLELHQIFDLKGSTVNREEPLTPEQVRATALILCVRLCLANFLWIQPLRCLAGRVWR